MYIRAETYADTLTHSHTHTHTRARPLVVDPLSFVFMHTHMRCIIRCPQSPAAFVFSVICVLFSLICDFLHFDRMFLVESYLCTLSSISLPHTHTHTHTHTHKHINTFFRSLSRSLFF